MFLRADGRPGGISAQTLYEAVVLSGSAATLLTSEELSLDLLTTFALGLTEERFATLLRRWSKAAHKVEALLSYVAIGVRRGKRARGGGRRRRRRRRWRRRRGGERRRRRRSDAVTDVAVVAEALVVARLLAELVVDPVDLQAARVAPRPRDAPHPVARMQARRVWDAARAPVGGDAGGVRGALEHRAVV